MNREIKLRALIKDIIYVKVIFFGIRIPLYDQSLVRVVVVVVFHWLIFTRGDARVNI